MLGCDIVQVSRIQRLMGFDGFLAKCFCQEEQSYFKQYKDPSPIIAGHFAAKEAVAKALGCGFGKHLDFLDFAITHDSLGKPYIRWQDGRTYTQCEISISHERDYAMAVAIIH